MIKNFTIGKQDIYIVSQDGLSMDLHNNASFEGIHLYSNFQKASLVWVYHGDRPNDPKRVKIEFDDISVLIMDLNLRSKPELDVPLYGMGYKWEDDFDHSWDLNEDEANERCHLMFYFYAGEYLRIYAEKATLVIE